MRRVCYLSGTRADFGLMQSTLKKIHDSPQTKLSVIATGMHLSERFGSTIREIEAAGFDIAARIPVNVDDDSSATMACNLSIILTGCVHVLEKLKPDIVLLLGDRGEMLAAALAAIHLGIPIVHIHGGERSGTVDEPVRHAISKLAHYHFVATEGARERLIKMGENVDHIWITGAPGLDGLRELACVDRESLFNGVKFDLSKPVALFVYHPVLQEAATAGVEAKILLDACIGKGLQVLALMPNSDAGSEAVRATLHEYSGREMVRVLAHLPRQHFVSWMKESDVMIGNSSSGIIEAATFGTPVINVGIRQNMRERNENVKDVMTQSDSIESSLVEVISKGRFPQKNIYEQEAVAVRISELLTQIDLSKKILLKSNAY